MTVSFDESTDRHHVNTKIKLYYKNEMVFLYVTFHTITILNTKVDFFCWDVGVVSQFAVSIHAVFQYTRSHDNEMVLYR